MYGGVEFRDYPDADNIGIMDHGCLPMIADMHKYGIRIDVPFLQSLSQRIAAIKEDNETIVGALIGNYQYRNSKGSYEPFKIGSRDHLSQLLFEELKIQGDTPIPRTPKDKRYEVSEEILEPFRESHPIVPEIIEWHSVEKLRNTYTDTLPLMVDSDSRLHTSFNATVAATGRLSSSYPNLQNIPVRTKLGKEIRRAFIAGQNMALVSSDLAQIEMVWAAHRSQDPTMLSVFRKGEDIHTRTTCNVFGLDYPEMAALIKSVDDKTATPDQLSRYAYFKQFQRLPCKTVGFGVLYGQTPEGLQSSLASDGVHWPIERCTKLINVEFFGVYPGLLRMLERDWATVKRYALCWDEFGRVRLVPEAKSVLRHIREEGVRKAGNHPEQASAQGNIKLAMAELTDIYRRMNRSAPCRPLLQIHDQLITEAHRSITQDVADIQAEILRNAVILSIPINASSDIGNCWAEL